MRYDMFISYSRQDNDRGQVAALKAQVESSFRAFAGRDIRFFFDTQEIQGMDDWRQKIQHSLRESHLFLAVLSPNYIASPYCRWEWEDYVRYEAMRQCLGEGVAPVFFVTLPNAATTQLDPSIVRWIEEINQRQTFDLRPWREHGEKALQEAHVRTTLEELHASIRERLESSGHKFAAGGPAETVAHAFEEYGMGCVDLFVGEFAFAIWDESEYRMIIVRDRLGAKPLYYFLVDLTRRLAWRLQNRKVLNVIA